MTVAELIAKLQEMPQDARVVVDGYEDGLKDASLVQTIPVVLNANTSSWTGPHKQWESYMNVQPDETAVYIPR